jgi:hypothetical protein
VPFFTRIRSWIIGSTVLLPLTTYSWTQARADSTAGDVVQPEGTPLDFPLQDPIIEEPIRPLGPITESPVRSVSNRLCGNVDWPLFLALLPAWMSLHSVKTRRRSYQRPADNGIQ